MNTMNTKHCGGCDQELPVGAFYKKSGSPDGLQAQCRNCALQKKRRWREENGHREGTIRPRTVVSTDGCGVAEHDDDCLCDVVITEITPINVRSVSDLWGGDAICKIFDMAGPWEPENLLDFFEKLLYGYDTHRGSVTSIRNIRPKIVERGNESLPQYWRRIRVVVDEVYFESPDANIVDVLQMIGVPVEDFRDTILSRRVMPDWTEDTLKEMQEDARNQISKNDFCRKYRLNPDKGRTGDRVYRMLSGTHYVDRASGGPNGGQTEQSAEVDRHVADNPSLDRTSLIEWHKRRWPDIQSSTRSNQIRRSLIRAGRLEGKQ